MTPDTPPSPTGALRDARRRAILCVLGSALAFALAAAAIKALGGTIPVAEVIVFRNLLALPLLLPMGLAQGGGWQVFRTRDPWGHAQRCAWGLLGMWGSFYGYAHLPLATVTALNFTMPFFLTALSIPLLGETVGPRRLAAVVAGFLGVVLVMRPWSGAQEAIDLVAAGWVLAAAFGWAMAMISIRRMGERGEPGVTIVLWFAVGAFAVSLLAAIPVWVWPSPQEWALLLFVGLISAVAQLMMTAAYRSGETTLIAPFEYSAILWTTGLGAILWSELPDGWDAAGIAVLVGSGLYIWWREVRLGVRR
ncbi:DMT family transporter [Roseomonas sp. OT10]|uniref:DMT family transporter n=1 Tax=Roseomonas cutis TaxID=2897332 RepID=UPI001E35E6B7|nr:DMT family transporter [Roseomonas sp. OT10]UFN47503.1 DMT family transporter [Roseomonas sp. OT10]